MGKEVKKMDKAEKPTVTKQPAKKKATPQKNTKFNITGNRGNTPLGR